MQQGSDRRPGPVSFEAAWRERFEEFAAERDDDAGIAGWSRTGLDSRMRRFCGLWQIGRGNEIWLDAGCGAGTYARWLADRGMRVVGVDYSVPTIRKALARGESAVQYVVSDVRHLPFSHGVFDGVLCFGVMQALGESIAALDELTALVRPDGELWIDALNRGCIVNAARIMWRRLRGREAHLRYEWPHVIAEVLRGKGFSVSLYWMPILPSRWQRFQAFIERPFCKGLLQAFPMVGSLVSHAFIVHARRGDGREATMGRPA